MFYKISMRCFALIGLILKQENAVQRIFNGHAEKNIFKKLLDNYINQLQTPMQSPVLYITSIKIIHQN